ncbi:hypothetical protein PHYBOEH_008092 [Phytophthora boehmeriae]|uniref:Uncharacterized protein n=1 Tax=Phytophthora boehmeriae TaxID=109152 RepID=A0A8T1X5X0_9STRA|nr:hypothetical protein PHYBOEH_008092 [Phytophthora boehmeriae]
MQKLPVIASTNLLDSQDFYVCESQVPGMNGHYVLQAPDVVQSDPNTPVFFREDNDANPVINLPATDFRLFRHNGFWMIADVDPWPPVTHFRCDPTKSHLVGTDVSRVCTMGQSTPPLMGYSAADPRNAVTRLNLHRHACQKQQQQQLRRMDVDGAKSLNNSFSAHKDEL